MRKIDIEKLISAKSPAFMKSMPGFIKNLLVRFLNYALHLKDINGFIESHQDTKGLEYIEDIFDFLDFSYLLSGKGRRNIPAEGKLIVVANHPLGALDGLAILKAIGEQRKDVKIVVNDLLMHLDNLSNLFIPFDVYSPKAQRSSINAIKDALLNEEVVIFLPAAEVSRFTLRGIYDGKWQKGAVSFAQKFQVPVLPVFVKGRNSMWFYALSLISKTFAMFLLPSEMFKKRKKTITIRIGDPIPGVSFNSNVMSAKDQTKLLKKHVYRIGRKRKGVFRTEKTIIRPVDKKLLIEELNNAYQLGLTSDGKKMLIAGYEKAPNTMKEIGRLRELTFRKVGEGTGSKYDVDKYDKFYKHLVLWDEENLEIMGSYRLGVCSEIIDKYGKHELYTASLFKFSDNFDPYLKQSLELGRSFIQQKYWGSKALDYLWQGIGAFLCQNPDIKYLFGPVSISDNYSEWAKNLLIYYYRKWYRDPENLARSRNRYMISKNQDFEIEQTLNGKDHQADFNNLKKTLKISGFTVPILFRRYTELCKMGGARFIDFGVDENFSNVVDGLIFLELEKLEDRKKDRYFKVRKSE